MRWDSFWSVLRLNKSDCLNLSTPTMKLWFSKLSKVWLNSIQTKTSKACSTWPKPTDLSLNWGLWLVPPGSKGPIWTGLSAMSNINSIKSESRFSSLAILSKILKGCEDSSTKSATNSKTPTSASASSLTYSWKLSVPSAGISASPWTKCPRVNKVLSTLFKSKNISTTWLSQLSN